MNDLKHLPPPVRRMILNVAFKTAYKALDVSTTSRQTISRNGGGGLTIGLARENLDLRVFYHVWGLTVEDVARSLRTLTGFDPYVKS